MEHSLKFNGLFNNIMGYLLVSHKEEGVHDLAVKLLQKIFGGRIYDARLENDPAKKTNPDIVVSRRSKRIAVELKTGTTAGMPGRMEFSGFEKVAIFVPKGMLIPEELAGKPAYSFFGYELYATCGGYQLSFYDQEREKPVNLQALKHAVFS